MKRKHYLQKQRTEWGNSGREEQLQHNIFFVAWVMKRGGLFGVFLRLVFFVLEAKKKARTVRCGFAYARCDNEFKSLLGKELLHGVFDFERARVHCL